MTITVPREEIIEMLTRYAREVGHIRTCYCHTKQKTI